MPEEEQKEPVVHRHEASQRRKTSVADIIAALKAKGVQPVLRSKRNLPDIIKDPEAVQETVDRVKREREEAIISDPKKSRRAEEKFLEARRKARESKRRPS